MARRKFTEDEIQLMRQLSAVRLPMYQMCTFFKNRKGQPYTPDGFQEALSYDDAARNAIDDSRNKAAGNVRQTLFQMAMGERQTDEHGRPTKKWARPPDMSAMRFWCETQEGFKRTIAIETKDKPNVETPEEREERLKELLRQRRLTDDE